MEGINVVELKFNILENILKVNLIWSHATPRAAETMPILSQGVLGMTGDAVSWLQGFEYETSHIVRFCTTNLVKDKSGSEVFEWYDVDAPALYSFAVRDFDEARGILALGNTFGELAVVDFSISDPYQLAECHAASPQPSPHLEQELVPIVSNILTMHEYF